MEEYELKNENLISNRINYLKRKRTDESKNAICENLNQVYPSLEFPTEEYLMKVGRKYAKQTDPIFFTNKYKELTMRNKHGNLHWKDYKNRSFVEDGIKLYKNLMQNGPKIFSIGGVKSGGRVVDSLTLMPSWIRNLCKINGKLIEEVDYSTLHPNIAIKIYGGSGKNINHDDVAEYLHISINKAKKEHLTFFNEEIEKMKHYNVFNYYFDNELDMLENLYKDKSSSKYGHKITSRRLFKIEVEIMSRAIKELNAMNIYMIYVYDALYCEPKHKETVVSVMNMVVKEFGINTTVK